MGRSPIMTAPINAVRRDVTRVDLGAGIEQPLGDLGVDREQQGGRAGRRIPPGLGAPIDQEVDRFTLMVDDRGGEGSLTIAAAEIRDRRRRRGAAAASRFGPRGRRWRAHGPRAHRDRAPGARSAATTSSASSSTARQVLRRELVSARLDERSRLGLGVSRRSWVRRSSIASSRAQPRAPPPSTSRSRASELTSLPPRGAGCAVRRPSTPTSVMIAVISSAGVTSKARLSAAVSSGAIARAEHLTTSSPARSSIGIAAPEAWRDRRCDSGAAT